MIITEITNQKKKGRYNIFVDGEFYSGLDAEGLIKSGFKTGMEIDKQKLDDIIIDCEKRSAFEKLINLISRQMYTKRELENKLIKQGYNKQAIELAIKQAEEYGYINDKEFAESLAKAKASKSRAEIKQALFQKGVSLDIIKETTDQVSEEDEKQRALELAKKYMKNKEVNQKTLASLYAYLSRKGFYGGAVSGAIRYFKNDFEEDL